MESLPSPGDRAPNFEVVPRGGAAGPGRQLLFQVLLVILAVAGAVICAALLAMSLPPDSSAGTSDSLGAKLCSPTARVNCDYVLASHWSKFRGISTSLIGLAYFAAAAVWFAAIGIPSYRGRIWHIAPMLLTAAGAIVSAWFVHVMATRLPVWCSWCLAAHGVNGVMLVLTWAAWPRRADGLAAHPTAARGWGVLASCVGAAILAALGAWSVQLQVAGRQIQQQYLLATNDPAYIAWRLSREPVREVPVAADDLFLGAADAKHTLVVFSDFECAQCRLFHQYARRMVNIFPGAVRIVLKHYPMSPQCNPQVATEMHFFSCEAGRAAEAARIAGDDAKALAYHAKLYDVTGMLDEQPYAALARHVGIDVTAFARAMASDEVRQRIERDAELGASLGVEGTPGIFVNGRRMRTSWHLVTSDVRPRLDLEATDALWAELLGISPARPSDAPSSRKSD